MSTLHIRSSSRIVSTLAALTVLSFAGHQSLGYQDPAAPSDSGMPSDTTPGSASTAGGSGIPSATFVDEPVTEERVEPNVTTMAFHLKYADAVETAALIEKLHSVDRGSNVTLVPDPRTNVVLYRGPDNDRLREVEQLMQILDTPDARPEPKTGGMPVGHDTEANFDSGDGGGGAPPIPSGSFARWYYYRTGKPPGDGTAPAPTTGSDDTWGPVQKLRSDAELQQDIALQSNRYALAEMSAREFADRFRAKSQEQASAEDQAAARQDVVVSVNRAFDARQQLQQAQINRFEARITRLRRAIVNRERLKAQIVERRANDLISDDAGNKQDYPERSGKPGNVNSVSPEQGSAASNGDPRSTSNAASDATQATPSVPRVGTSELQVILVSINSTSTGAGGQAWVLDQGSSTLAVLRPGSAFRLGSKLTQVIEIHRDFLEVRRDGELRRWLLGQNVLGGRAPGDVLPSAKSAKTVVTIPVPIPETVEQFPLNNIDPNEATQTIRGVLGQGGVSLELLPEQNVFIVKGAESDVRKVRALLGMLQRAQQPSTDNRLPGPPIRVSDGISTGGWLKSPEDYFEALTNARQQVQSWKSRLAEKLSGRSDDALSEARLQQQLATIERRLELIEGGYRAQIRLLQIDLEQAHDQRDAADRAIDSIRKLVEAGAAPSAQLRALESDMLKADGDLERAKALYEIYIRAGEPLPEPANTQPDPAAVGEDESDGGRVETPEDESTDE